jgi:HD-GYP domain-containing protein (c-di-GMP phosphodiesterase class II)/sensor domain CHASE-containing protein/HAMP domain-containing protein
VRRTFTWNVRNRLLVAFLIVAVVPLVVFGALVYARTSSALRDVERQQIVAQARGAREILRDKTRDQSEFIHDYSVWDGFHNALSTGNLAWVRSNVTEWVPANSSTNLVRVFDTAGKSLAAGGDTVPADLWAKDEVKAARRGVISADLEILGGRLYVLAAAPVLAQTHPSRPAGIVVFGQAVSDDVLKDINRFTGGLGRLAVYTKKGVSAATDPAEANALATFRPGDFASGQVFREGGYASQLVAIDDDEGVVVSTLKVSVPRQAFSDALGQINGVTVAAFALALIIALLMGLLVAHTISAPLRRLATAATGIAHGDLRQSLHLGRNDEIGALADAFDVMSERVACQVEDLSEKSRNLALEISNLSAFGTTLARTADPHAELRRLADMIRAMHGADAASVYLVYEGQTARAAFSGGRQSPVPSPAADELAAWVVTHGSSVQVADAETEERLSALARGANLLNSLLVVPLARQEGVIGALCIGFADQHEFGPEEMPLLSTIGGQIAIALQNAEAYEKLDRMYLETVTALAAAMEAKDQYTASHADSLAAMAVAVGSRMGMSDGELRMLQYAAVLHDIGKIGIPGSILNKPERLTRNEFDTMAQHTVIGERIISRIDYLVPIARIIRSAHERWDGSGYPDGLSGERIPLAARILLVCDAFDAMTTDRPYRRALPIDAALLELSANAGAQFDPRVVDVFLASYPFKAAETDRVISRLSYAGLVESN